MPDLVQMSQRTVSVEKVPRGQKPVFEFDLEPHETIVSVQHYWTTDYASRKTVDHHAWVFIATRLEVPDGD